MLLLRLSPLVPYNALDYVSGVTSISIPHYCQALVGLLPGTVTLCYIGGTASSLTSGKSAVTEIRTIAMIVGIVFAAAGAGVASYYSKIELDKMLAEQRDENDEMESIPQPLMMSDTLILEPALMDAAAGRQSSGHDSASYHAIPRSMYTDGLDNP